MRDLRRMMLPTTSAWTRILRGGVSLTRFEGFLLQTLAQHVPSDMASALQEQWRGLNLIQRSPDWQELRFYPLVRGRVNRSRLPPLPLREGEVKLLSLALRSTQERERTHVNFWAVDRRFFVVNANRTLEPFRDLAEMPIEAVEHSYRSNLVRDNTCQATPKTEPSMDLGLLDEAR